jgi:hypothetical protein
MSEDGEPLDRHTAAAAAGALPSSSLPGVPEKDELLSWRFATEVPPHWFPLVPDQSGAPKFDKLILHRVHNDGSPIRPLGALLAPDDQWFWQEEVPREGARVIRRARMARGDDGRLYVWIGRRSEAGRGEGSSGLRYDDAVPVSAGPH